MTDNASNSLIFVQPELLNGSLDRSRPIAAMLSRRSHLTFDCVVAERRFEVFCLNLARAVISKLQTTNHKP